MTEFEKCKTAAYRIAELVREHGGHTYYVGGYVRDALLGIDNKDIDIEVHGVSPKCLENILDSVGERITIGESFGIYNLKGLNVDIAMPRKEKATGTGHRDFDVIVDPFIGTEKASARRDFTVNSIMQDVLTGEITDHHGGVRDLNAKILRHVNDETFGEDPLRVLRGAQFAARFEFEVAPETVLLCSKMDISMLSKERIEGELKKALLKAEKPSVFFDVLRKMNRLSEWFGEVQALIGVEQNPKYHSEGDVWTHTMLVLDEAAKFRDKVSNPFGFMLSALTHDFGKAVCTELINGELHAYAHETKGLPIAESFLRRITNETQLIKYVLNMTELHMKPNVTAAANSSIKATNRMFDSSIDPEALIYIALADAISSAAKGDYVPHDDFLYERLEIYKEYMSRPYVMGKDLIEAGIEPGRDFTEILEYAHKLRLAGEEKSRALKQVIAYAKKLRNDNGK